MQRRRKRTDQPLRPRNRRVTRRSDLGRTLFTAGVFALLSMIFAPKAHYGYRLIFSAEATSIAFFQLMVNVGFAALLGAILATITPKIVRGVRELPRWAWQGIAGIVVIAPCLA